MIKLKIGNRGQAFSTFQLLIAAVAALALLGVLMPMIINIPGVSGDPVDAMKEKIKTQIDNPGNIAYTSVVKFSAKKNEVISAISVITGSGLAKDQISFSTNGYDNHFRTDDGKILEILTQEAVKYKVGILCARPGELVETLDQYSSMLPNITIENEDLDEEATTCIIFPKKV